MDRLITFVQISDLHIGDFDTNLDSVAPSYWAKWRRFQGLLGHHFVALDQLAEFYESLRQREDARLIVTGDLTTCGHPNQFQTAAQFLSAKLEPAFGGIGLHAPAWILHGISGNHDYWSGRNFPLGGPTESLRQVFPYQPISIATQPLTDKHFIRFIAIDTDADVWNWTKTRLYARGRFASQIAEAGKMVRKEREMYEIRVVLLHHSRIFSEQNGYAGELSIVRDSAAVLDQFLVDYDVALLLCGHTHRAHMNWFTAIHPNREQKKVFECCCGTTTQRDYIPPQWSTILGGWPNWTPSANTLVVHRVFRDNERILWRPEVFVRKNQGFQSSHFMPPFAVWT